MAFPSYPDLVSYNQGLKAPLLYVLAYAAKFGAKPDSLDHFNAFTNQINAAATVGPNPAFMAAFVVKNARFPSEMPAPAAPLDYWQQFLNDVSARDPASGKLTPTASQSFNWLNSYFSDPSGHPGTFFYPPGSSPATVPMGAPSSGGTPTPGPPAPTTDGSGTGLGTLPTTSAGWLALVQAHPRETAAIGLGVLLLLKGGR